MGKNLAVLNTDGSIVSASSEFRGCFHLAPEKGAVNIQDLLCFDVKDIQKTETDHFFPSVPLKSNNGKTIDFFLHSLKDPEGKILALVMSVIDAKSSGKKIEFDEENLCHLDRLTHIGKLSASIAHEIGNPLGGILAAAHGLKKKLTGTEEKEYIDMIIDDIAAIKNTIESLRDFARRSKPNLVSSDLKEILKRTLHLVQPEMRKKRIHFTENYPEYPISIKVDPEQLRQVFLNILLNAAAAVEEEGSITLSVSESKYKNGKDYFQITVTDNGAGMTPETLSRIYTPFYTTKAKGLGLGLCVTRKIIEDHDGYIEVTSETGAGSHFNIYLRKEQTT